MSLLIQCICIICMQVEVQGNCMKWSKFSGKVGDASLISQGFNEYSHYEVILLRRLTTPALRHVTDTLFVLALVIGLALAARRTGRTYRTYCLLGDGELQEGQVWEAAMTAAHFALDTVCAIVDDNGVQLDGPTREIMNVAPLADKFRAFGWQVLSVDGHSLDALAGAFRQAAATRGRPTVLLARTVKGKGVSFMEGQPAWHGKAPNDQELAAALAELAEGGTL